jgi:hypothetical protein
MKKASEYRKHAEECRVLARGLKGGPQRDQLLEMAKNWDQMAEDRDRLARRHPEISLDDKPSDKS